MIIDGSSCRVAEYYVHGRGRGHASRSFAVRLALDSAGFETRLHAGGQAFDLIDETSASERPPLTRGSMAPARLVGRSLLDAAKMLSRRPDLVVSDGDQAAVVGASCVGIPTLVIGHDQVFDRRVRLARLPKGPLSAQRLNAFPMRAAERWIAVHFLPATSSDERLRVARPEFPVTVPTQENPDGPVVCYFRDRNAEHLLRAVADLGKRVLSFAGPEIQYPGVHCQPFSRLAFSRAMATCSAVIGSAGSSLLAECVERGKPVMALYAPSDSEQTLNAAMIQNAGVGMGCEVSLATSRLSRFFRQVRLRDFARVDLAAALPPLSAAVSSTLLDLVPSTQSVVGLTH